MEQNDKEKIKRGILTKKVTSWMEFVQFVFHKHSPGKGNMEHDAPEEIGNYVWRGHRCSCWKLESLFDRKKRNSDKRDNVLGKHRRSFIYATRGRLEEFGLSIRELKMLNREHILSEEHLWALAQHYELATPLLDWSTSPFVAAYFAFEGASRLEDTDWDKLDKDTEWSEIRKKMKDNQQRESLPYHDRTVIGLNYRHVCQNTGLKPFSPMSSEHPRLINQRGLFTLAKNGEDIETTIQNNWKEGDPWLIKIHIPNAPREDFLHALNLMNINGASLFPDINGAARFCNVGLEISDYSTFPGVD
ncbi:MAG: FRG domain-containing protein [Sedimentisphaerales bacterium]